MTQSISPSTPTDETPEASVLVVGYRSKPYIERCIEGALLASASESVEFLFIDCSDDGSEALVRGRFPSVRVLPFQGNLGFARGNNVLARHARGSKILLLNPDAFCRADEIAALLKVSRARPDAAVWSGITVLPSGAIDPGSMQPMLGALHLILGTLGLGSRVRPGAVKLDRPVPQSVPVVTGAFMLVRASIWTRLGGFDESFFMYAEEVDLCKRIARDGDILLCDPRIRLLHDTGSGARNSPTRILNRTRGNATFYDKHFGPVWSTVCKLLALVFALTRVVGGGIFRRKDLTSSYGPIILRPSAWWRGWRPEDEPR